MAIYEETLTDLEDFLETIPSKNTKQSYKNGIMRMEEFSGQWEKNLKEIKKQHRWKRLRRLLKFLLIGFLIGRDSNRKISELTSKNELIIENLFKRFKDSKHIAKRVKEFADAYTDLIHIEKSVKEFKEEIADAQNLVLKMEEKLRKYLEMIVRYAKRANEQREQAIDKQVAGILNSDTYLIHSDKKSCFDAMKSFQEDLNYCDQSDVLDNEYIDEKKKTLEKNRQTVLDYNKNFINQRKKDYSYLWSKGPFSLDDEQQTAIVTDDKHNLVVAAAGSGKTEVLITRIAYLIGRKPDHVKPKRILAIAYQRKAKEEVEQRLRDRFNIKKVNVRTFHKLGKDILEETGREFRRTDIVDGNKKHEVIQKIFDSKIANEPDFYKLFLQFVKTLHDKETEEKGKGKAEALIYALERAYYSMNNVRVNSRAEKEILDFFLAYKLNGKPIGVKYEPDVDGFRPDFYLPQYDLFIEHWALNEKGEVPDWFSQSTKEYRKSMEMKKKWFAEHDKMFVETFTYEYDEDDSDKFIELLKNRIIKTLQTKHDCNFEFTPMTYEEIVDVAWQSYRTPIDDIVNFITSAKTYGLTPSKIAGRLQKMEWTRKQLAFGSLTLPVYSVYEEFLKEHESIDFEDMINSAIEALDNDQNLRADVYDHILVDEYQDVSAQRYKLIKKLLERNPKCKLFCVGDNWQSVMGFSGSNLNFFVNFDKFFENPATTKISTNYRSVKSIVDAGADLIKNNSSCQIQKPTLSNREEGRPIRVLKLLHKKKYEGNYHRQTSEDCFTRVANYIKHGYSPGDILVLTGYMRTWVARGYRFLSIIRMFMEKAKENGIEIAYGNAEAQSKVRLLTVHKSKGLEAKVVFILNVIKDPYGFPCEIDDPSIYEPARENYPPQDQKEEERRLFYVAITRAKEDLYIYTWEPAKSEFLEEIENHIQELRLEY